MSWEPWHIEMAGVRGGAPAPSHDHQGHDDHGADGALADAGIEATDGALFFSEAFGVDAATALFGADPNARASDLLPQSLLAEAPALADMTAGEARLWADRRAVVKASDMAAQRVRVDTISDPDVRDAAMAALNDNIAQRQRLEAASSVEYEARLQAEDRSLSEGEVLADNNLSDQAQNEIINELRDQRSEARAISQTVSQLNDPATVWNPYDTKQRGAVDDAYSASLGDEPVMSENGMTQAALIASRTGVVPETMFDALRAAVNSGDPAALAQSMEFAGQLLERAPNAFGPHGGKTDITGPLSDYNFLSGFMGSEAAAARMVENNSAEAVANRDRITAADARTVAGETIDIGDVTGRLETLGVGAEITDNPDAQGAIMDDYSRLFADAYRATGDRELAKNRTLDDMSRVYGHSGVGGRTSVMRFPPASFAPTHNGSHDWMAERLAEDVNAAVFGDDMPNAIPMIPGAALVGEVLGTPRPIRSADIMLSSDTRTARDVAAGVMPSYRITYMDSDGVIETLPQRYSFDAPPAEEEPVLRITREQFDARNAEQLGREYMTANPGLFNPATELDRATRQQWNMINDDRIE